MSSIPIKRSHEVTAMRASGRLVRSLLEEVRHFVEPGQTTKEVDAYAASRIKQVGARSAFLGYKGFPGNICISVNEEVVHGIGGSRRIQYGDIVKVDIGIFKDGWIGDAATTIPVGMIDPKTVRLLKITEESLYVGIQQARVGRRVGDVSAAIEEFVLRHGYSVVKEFVGHGVGRKLHEEPQVPNYGKYGSGPKLKPGMTIAIEPMVNMGEPEVRVLGDSWTVVAIDGLPSSHFEHTVLITEDEPEILTCLTTTLAPTPIATTSK
jgi:methionyl aminopeptidase